MGDPERLPVKRAKAAKPQRHGTIFWLERGGRVLLVTRPAKGLLGGMRAFPTGPWVDTPPGLEGAPVAGAWRLLAEGVTHAFTHFDLDLRLAVAQGAGHDADAIVGEWWQVDDLAAAGLPTVFAKAGAAIGRGR